MEIKVRIDKGFGHRRVYPVCDKAQLFAKIAGRTCLEQDGVGIIVDIKELGYSVVIEQETV